MSVRHIPSREELPADDSPANRSSWRKSKTLEGVVIPPDIAAIKRLEDEYDTVHAQAVADGFDNRWETARRYAEALDDGNSQHTIARLVGKSQPHVSYMAKVWRKYGDNQVISPYQFSGYYQSVKKAAETAEQKAIGRAKERSGSNGAAAEERGFSYDELVNCGAGTRQASDQEFIELLAEVCEEKGLASRTSGQAAAEFRMEIAIKKAQERLRKAPEGVKANGSAGNGPRPECTCVTCPVHGEAS